MAKYPVTYVCGHSGFLFLDSTAERKSKLYWSRWTPCPDCKGKAELEAAQLAAEMAGLPRLQGNVHAIKRAIVIRAAKLRDLTETKEDLLLDLESLTIDASIVNEQAEKMNTVIEHITAKTSADWWDRRKDDTGYRLIDDAEEELMAQGDPQPREPKPRGVRADLGKEIMASLISLAAREGVDPSELATRWLIERIAQEQTLDTEPPHDE